MSELHAKPAGKDAALLHLGAFAAGALLLTCVAGFLVYSSIRRLATAKDGVEHTQEVLTSIESISQLTQRVASSTEVYALNGDRGELQNALSAQNQLESQLGELSALVEEEEDSGEKQNVQDLRTCSAGLSADLRNVHPTVRLSPDRLTACRSVLSRMTDRERAVLKQRIKSSQHSSVISFTSDWVLVGLFLLMLLGLFGLLARDALLRRRLVRQTSIANQNIHALERHVEESLLLTFCRDELQLCVEAPQAYRCAAGCFAHLLPASTGALSIFNTQRNLVEVASTWGSGEGWAIADSFEPTACCGLRLGELRWRRPGMSEIDCAHFTGDPPSRYLCIPIIAQGDTLGVLFVECADESLYLSLQRKLESVREVLQLTGMTVAALQLRTRLESQSIRDSLTGLFNRHFMEIVLTRELAQAARGQRTLALFMIDVDHFKRFNDSFGHLAGDMMLKAVGEVFRATVREEDTVCRYGGEEFVIILPGITPDVAWERAELIRNAVARLRVPVEANTSGQATVSIGIALTPNDATQAEPLLHKADSALYRAKRSGRNRVSLSEVLTNFR